MSKESTATTPSTRPTITRADEMVGRVLTASLGRALAALPDAITTSMKKTVPDLYTPELAAALANDITARLLHAHQVEVTA